MSSKDYEARDRDEEQRRKLDETNYIGKVIRMFVMQDHSCCNYELSCIIFFITRDHLPRTATV
jgi:hypothetical protein